MKAEQKKELKTVLRLYLVIVLAAGLCAGGLFGLVGWLTGSSEAAHVRKAEALIAAGEYEAACAEYTKANGYPFGGYRWIVVDYDGDNALLVMTSPCALPFMAFDETGAANDWQDCSLQAWLNGAFLDGFTDAEQARIVSAPGTGDLGTEKVFLPSVEEFDAYLQGRGSGLSWSATDVDSTRVWERARRGLHGDYYNKFYWWWLRTPGMRQGCVAIVNERGEVSREGYPANTPDGAVRPAMWVKL
ncbi:MAG: DUF6273 domain-containing protein [Christensenellaceae bacterium]|jgi:hypothetical protein|nr:DUF6273 domain-containing protein [Christensenellaceae bacterium]